MASGNFIADGAFELAESPHGENHPGHELPDGKSLPGFHRDAQKTGKTVHDLPENQAQGDENHGEDEIFQEYLPAPLEFFYDLLFSEIGHVFLRHV
jgi:hypothetical protein